MRTLPEIQETAIRLNDGQKVKVSLNPKLKYADGRCDVLTGAIDLHPAYLDEDSASDQHLQAALLHELGHAHDPLYFWPWITMLAAVVVWAVLVAYAMVAHTQDAVLAGVAVFGVVFAVFLYYMKDRESRADAWARARMPDFDAYKNLTDED